MERFIYSSPALLKKACGAHKEKQFRKWRKHIPVGWGKKENCINRTSILLPYTYQVSQPYPSRIGVGQTILCSGCYPMCCWMLHPTHWMPIETNPPTMWSGHNHSVEKHYSTGIRATSWNPLQSKHCDLPVFKKGLGIIDCVPCTMGSTVLCNLATKVFNNNKNSTD